MRYSALTAALLMLAGTPAAAKEGMTGQEIVEKAQEAFFYPGADMKAKVRMELITASGEKRVRVLTMLRKNDPSSRNQQYFMYFHEPGDVRRMSFLVWKYPEKDDDRWIFIPAVNMVRRVAASDSRSSFVGSDFTYEDVSGRDVSADSHTFLKDGKLGDVDCRVVESVPNAPMDYAKKVTWIGKNSFLPLKEEYYDVQGELIRTFTADVVQDVEVGTGGGKRVIPTVTKRTMKNAKTGHRTGVTFESIAYDLGLRDGIFTERSLQEPPLAQIK